MGGQNDGAADNHRQRAERVAGDVQHRGTHVQIAVHAADEHRADRQIHDQPDGSDRQHEPARGFDRCEEAPDRFDDDRNRYAEEQTAVGQRGENLQPRETERLAHVCRPRRLQTRAQRDRQRDDVHGDVRGVGEQGQRSGPQTAGELEQRDERGAGQRNLQLARADRGVIVGGRMVVLVRVMVGSGVQHEPTLEEP